MFANLKIRTGLLLLLGVFTLALWWAVGTAWSNAVQSARAMDEINRLSDNEIEPLHETQRLLLATLVNMDNAYINLQRGDQVTATDYTRKASALRVNAAKIFKAWHDDVMAHDAGAGGEIRRISAAYDSYGKVLDAREEALYDVSLDSYVAATAGAEQADATFQSTLLDVIRVSQERRDALKRKSNQRAELAGRVAIGLTVLSMLLVAGYWIFVDRMLLRPLRRATQQLEKIAGGDLGTPVAADSRTEIGLLLKALKRMQADLTQTVSTIRQGADDVSRGIAGIAGDNVELSSRTEQQASALEETAATLEELTAAVRQNADNTRQTDEFARTAKDDAVRGSRIVAGVADTMDAVSASAARISDIVGVIDGIAFQTNILALNASVEAARASVHGRGFAVVAAEVRSLALRCAQAAKEVKALIDESDRRVKSGTLQAAEAGEAMRQIVASVERVTGTMKEIAVATAEQSDAIEQVSRAVVELDRTTQQNAALVERTATAAGSLNGEAGRLVDSVSVFRLPGELPSLPPSLPEGRTGMSLPVTGAISMEPV